MEYLWSTPLFNLTKKCVCVGVCVCLCVCVFVCLRGNSKSNRSRKMKFKCIVVYENLGQVQYFRHCWIKVKVTVRL